jgi:ribonucleotide monophosphatase NagD (HAD superfamily)
MNVRKIAMLRRQETKRERGLLRDCDGKLIVGQPKIKSRADLIRRMYANGYKGESNA